LGTEKGLFVSGRPARRDDSHDVAVTLGPDDHDQTALDRPNCDEAILVVGMVVVEPLKIARTEV
jgi:hypothetical protein